MFADQRPARDRGARLRLAADRRTPRPERRRRWTSSASCSPAGRSAPSPTPPRSSPTARRAGRSRSSLRRRVGRAVRRGHLAPPAHAGAAHQPAHAAHPDLRRGHQRQLDVLARGRGDPVPAAAALPDRLRWSAIKSGSVVLFVFVGNIAIKPATTWLFNRFGFRTHAAGRHDRPGRDGRRRRPAHGRHAGGRRRPRGGAERRRALGRAHGLHDARPQRRPARADARRQRAGLDRPAALLRTRGGGGHRRPARRRCARRPAARPRRRGHRLHRRLRPPRPGGAGQRRRRAAPAPQRRRGARRGAGDALSRRSRARRAAAGAPSRPR